MSHKIELLDKDESINADEGQTILQALLDSGIDWMHACGGFCNCTTCRVKIEDGQDNVSDMERDEKNTLRRFQGEEVLEGPFRLSCQVTVHGDIKISEPEWY